MSRPTNRGFSLLEIILALAIFGVAMAMLGNIVSNGATAAIEARDLARAQILCESKMAEVLLLDGGPQSINEIPLDCSDTLRQWQHSVSAAPAQVSGMLSVSVMVESIATDPSVIPVRFVLTRWIVDPALELQAAEDEAAAEAEVSDE